MGAVAAAAIVVPMLAGGRTASAYQNACTAVRVYGGATIVVCRGDVYSADNPTNGHHIDQVSTDPKNHLDVSETSHIDRPVSPHLDVDPN